MRTFTSPTVSRIEMFFDRIWIAWRSVHVLDLNEPSRKKITAYELSYWLFATLPAFALIQVAHETSPITVALYVLMIALCEYAWNGHLWSERVRPIGKIVKTDTHLSITNARTYSPLKVAFHYFLTSILLMMTGVIFALIWTGYQPVWPSLAELANVGITLTLPVAFGLLIITIIRNSFRGQIFSTKEQWTQE